MVPENHIMQYLIGYRTWKILIQPKLVRIDAMDRVSNITYNPRGQRENIYYGNNTKTRYYYHPLNFRLTRILTTRNNGQDILQDLNYSYDSVGNITGITDNAQQTFYFNNQVIAPTGSYQYDALYRLLHATGREQTTLTIPTDSDFVNNIPCPDTATNAMQNYTQHYQYDALGNMLQMSSQGQWARDYIYATATNRLLKHDSQQTFDDYTYDEHGNMLSMPHLPSMEYDYKDELFMADNETYKSYYNYDAEGNRTRKVVEKNNIREERYYVNGYEIYRKYVNGTLDIERKTVNISDDEKVFVRIETKTGENPVIRYQYDNHLGSACLELDDSGQIISYEEYHPFGTTSYRSGRNETEVSLKRYKYCGKERDEETGLYYYGMRYYAAWLCRFVSVDPLQFRYPELTPFQYASNRPVTMIDLDGKEGVYPENQQEPADDNISNIQIKGNTADVDAFINMLNQRTGNIYDLAGDYLCVEQDNNVTVSDPNVSSDLGDLIRGLFENQIKLPVNIVRDSDKAVFDNFDRSLVDIGDLEKVNSILQAANIGHFLEEWSSVSGYSDSTNRTDQSYDAGHKRGLIMESKIANTMLGQPYSLVSDKKETIKGYTTFEVIKDDYTLEEQKRMISAYDQVTLKYGNTSLSYQLPYKVSINREYRYVDFSPLKFTLKLLQNVITVGFPTNNIR